MTSRLATHRDHQERINAVLFHIHAHLDGDLDIAVLAEVSCYSAYHFQRAFKEICGESVHTYVLRTRLEWAANLLIFNPQSMVLEVAASCGFKSNASFSHAFKRRFGVTPGEWRNGGYQAISEHLKSIWLTQEENPNKDYYLRSEADVRLLVSQFKVQVKRLPPQNVAYIRYTGYDRGISGVWEQLLDWIRSEGLVGEERQMIGLYHSNPEVIPYDQCRYVACVSVPRGTYRRSGVGVMEIPGGLYATARGHGSYGELIALLHFLYHVWLPQSGYQTISIPAHVRYFRNHFLDGSPDFDAEMRIPLCYR